MALSSFLAVTFERLVKLTALSIYRVCYRKKIPGQVQFYAWLSGGAKQPAWARGPALTLADAALICRTWLACSKRTLAAGFGFCCSALLQIKLQKQNEQN